MGNWEWTNDEIALHFVILVYTSSANHKASRGRANQNARYQRAQLRALVVV